MTEAEQRELAELEELEKLEAQYGSQVPRAPKAAPKTIQEQHPKIGALERLVVKNFSNSPEASVAYLKKRLPDLEIVSDNGQIKVRAPGEQDFRVIDPDTGLHPIDNPKEALMDALDVGYDIPAGVASGAASTAAAIPAGIATGGIGALPAAMAAGGASSAGLEALRQKLGQLAGIPQDVQGKDVAASGAIGLAGPLLFGAGAGKGAVEKAAKGSLTKEALEKVMASMRGLPGRAMDWAGENVLPAYGAMAGGIPAETTKSLRKFLPEIRELEKSGVTGPVEEIQSRLVGGLARGKRQVGEALEASIDASSTPADLAAIRAPLERAIAEARAEAQALPNKATAERLSQLEQTYGDLFKSTAGEMLPDKIPAKTAFNLQDQLADQADLFKVGQGPQSRFGAGATRGEKRTSEAVRESYNATNDELDKATQGLSPALKDKYRQMMMIQKDLQPMFKTPEQTFKTLSTLAKRDRKFLFEKLKNIETEQGIPILDDARKLEAFATYANPSLMAQSGLGSTSTGRTVPAQALGAAVGGVLGTKVAGPMGLLPGIWAGKMAGSWAGSPSMLRKSVELETALRGARGTAAPAAVPTLFGAGKSAWQAMQEQDE